LDDVINRGNLESPVQALSHTQGIIIYWSMAIVYLILQFLQIVVFLLKHFHDTNDHAFRFFIFVINVSAWYQCAEECAVEAIKILRHLSW